MFMFSAAAQSPNNAVFAAHLRTEEIIHYLFISQSIKERHSAEPCKEE